MELITQYHPWKFGDVKLDNLADLKLRRTVKGLLKKYGIDKKTRSILVDRAGFRGVQEIYDCTNEDLLSIDGIGSKRLGHIRLQMLPYFLHIV